ncbi:MAG TPA: hypothetical protein DIS96_08980 [Pusillimonas sp.]|nr:hypothetical protein [Pusillimonas sp.]|tara:strand:- start:797 stop:1195 length:399 start_codon:yes stop_codon:yes gene_type:complete
MKLLSILVCLFMLAGCAKSAPYDDEIMYDHASELKDIVQIVDGEVKFGANDGLSSDAIIQKALKTRPNALDSFSPYSVEFAISGDDAVVLMCDGNVGLIEDAGCTAKVERILWSNPEPDTCRFALDTSQMCY